MKKTQYTNETGVVLKYVRGSGWGHFDINDKGRCAHVGPWYGSFTEILMNHKDYLVRAGWLRQDQS